MSIESRLADVEESLRLLRDANRLQGRPLSAEAPGHGDVASWNATTKKWEPVSGVTIIDRDLTQVDIVSDTDLESVYSHSIPASTMGTTGGIRVMIGGDMLVNTAGTLTISVKLGATTAFSSGAMNLTDDADRYLWTFQIWVMNSSATAQKWNGAFNAISGTGEFSGQIGDNNRALHMEGYVGSSEDTTGALTFDFLVQWSASSASLSFRKEMAIMELLAAT